MQSDSKIEPDKNLPDLILADLGPTEPLIVFVEVVATDGAITLRRQEAIYSLTDAAGFHRSQIAFLSAYLDRDSAGFKKTIAGLAWNSFAWFVGTGEYCLPPGWYRRPGTTFRTSSWPWQLVSSRLAHRHRRAPVAQLEIEIAGIDKDSKPLSQDEDRIANVERVGE